MLSIAFCIAVCLRLRCCVLVAWLRSAFAIGGSFALMSGSSKNRNVDDVCVCLFAHVVSFWVAVCNLLLPGHLVDFFSF